MTAARRVHARRQPPSPAELHAVLGAHAGERFTLAPGLTDGPCPRGMRENAARGVVGQGDRDFAAAAAAVSALRMFDVPWMRCVAEGAPLGVGSGVAVSGRVLGFWWTNVCRVVRVLAEPRRRGFVYATLRPHLMAGEERFAVTTGPDGAVWFELTAYAKPAHALTFLGWPLVRAMQRRFARDAVAAIAAAVRMRAAVPANAASSRT